MRRKELVGEVTFLLVTMAPNFCCRYKRPLPGTVWPSHALWLSSTLPLLCSMPPWFLLLPNNLWSVRLCMQRASWGVRAVRGVYNAVLHNLDVNIRQPVLKSSLNSTVPSLQPSPHLFTNCLFPSLCFFVCLGQSPWVLPSAPKIPSIFLNKDSSVVVRGTQVAAF